MIESAIGRHLIDNISQISFTIGNRHFAFFGKMPVPIPDGDNDFDMLLDIVGKMMAVVGAVMCRELIPALYLARANYKFPDVDFTKVYSSDRYSIKNAEKPPLEAHSSISPEFYERMVKLSGDYSSFFEEKWDTLGPVVRLNLDRSGMSNFYSALLNQQLSLETVYEFLCSVYDEALDENKHDVMIEVMQLAALNAEMYPRFTGFHDLLGVAHYNRCEFSSAIERWKLAKEGLLLEFEQSEKKEGIDSADPEAFSAETVQKMMEKIDSMIASAEYKQHLNIACDLSEADPDTALRHFEAARPVFSDWWVFCYYLGIAYQTKKQWNQAMKYFQRTTELFSGCHEAHERMAEIYEEKGECENAYESLAQSLKIYPSNGEVLGKIILVADKIGRIGKVAKLIKQAKKFDANNPYVRRAENLLSDRNGKISCRE